MNIAVDASCWNNRRGFGRFTREILKALLEIDHSNRYFFLADEHTARDSEFPAGVTPLIIATREQPTMAAGADGSRSIRDILRMSWATRLRFDLIYYPAVYSYFPAIPWKKCIVTFHDAIAEHHPDLVFPNLRARYFWNLKCHLAMWQSDIVITVSQYARATVIKQWKIDPQRVRQVSEAPSSVFRKTDDAEQADRILRRFGLGVDSRYLLYVGGISPHKNLEFLVKSFYETLEQFPEIHLKLILAGDYHTDVFYSSFPTVRTLVASHTDQTVFFTGYIPDEELVHLYNFAFALVLPSLEEGFGLPVVEAMACGAPVIVSRTGSLPEVVSGAGLLFDPREPADLRQRICQLVTDCDLRQELSRRSLARAKDFSWKRSASQLLDIFASAGNQARHQRGR